MLKSKFTRDCSTKNSHENIVPLALNGHLLVGFLWFVRHGLVAGPKRYCPATCQF
jgi:hypothetical protein